MIRIHDINLDALEDLIEGANGKLVLIAYWYKSYLRRLKDKFDVRELKTNEDFKEWNQGKIPVALPIQNLLVMDLIYKLEMITTQFRKE